MTEVTLNKKVFLSTLEAFRKQFELESATASFETEPSGDRFRLTARRSDAPADVQAFGPCEVKGAPVSVAFDMVDLAAAIRDAHKDTSAERVTLLIAEGVWVKDPAPQEDAKPKG